MVLARVVFARAARVVKPSKPLSSRFKPLSPFLTSWPNFSIIGPKLAKIGFLEVLIEVVLMEVVGWAVGW